MKLTYWVAPRLDDSESYSIRAKTRKECKRLLALAEYYGEFGPIRKVVVEYQSGFALVEQCLSEGRIYEGDSAESDTVSYII